MNIKKIHAEIEMYTYYNQTLSREAFHYLKSQGITKYGDLWAYCKQNNIKRLSIESS